MDDIAFSIYNFLRLSIFDAVFLETAENQTEFQLDRSGRYGAQMEPVAAALDFTRVL